MMNNHYNSRAGDFNNLKEQSIDVIYTEGLRRLEGYITTLGTIDSIIRSSGISSENISTLSKTYQGETPMDSIIARNMNLDIQEYHRLRGLAPRIHGELIQNIDSQLSYQFSVLLNQITANNGDNKYITGIEGEREVTITGYDEYGTPTEYTYIEKYNLSLDELMDVENTPVQAIQDYYIEKVNLYRYGVLEGDYTPEQKQEIFNQSIGDTATNFYTGDLGEFIIQDSTEDRLRKEAYEKDIGWKQIISWATLAISIIAIPLTWGASLAISGVSMFVMAGTVMTVTAAGWMAFTAGYSFITGYDFYTGERLTDNEKWITGMIALASAIPVIGRLAKTVRWMDGLSKIGSKAAQFFFNFGDDALDILGGIIKYNDTGDLFGSIMHGAVGILSFSGAGLYGLVRKLSGLKNVKTLLESFDQLSDADLKSRLKGMDDNQIKNFFKQLDDASLKRAISVFDDVDLKGLLKNLDDASIKRIINSLGDTDLKGVFKNLDDTDITMLKKYLLGGGDTELLENIVISIKNGDTIDLDSSLLKKIKGSDDIITDGSHLVDGKLTPNTTYTSGEHGYTYTTNSDGVIVKAHADLQLKTHDGRLVHNPNTLGKLDGDHAGHIFGDRFGGSPELDNLVSQAQKVNLSEYKILENQWATALENGSEVIVDLKIVYDVGGIRPISFEVDYMIDGIDFHKVIVN